MLAGRLTLGMRIALLVVLCLGVVLSLFGYLSLRSLRESSDRALNERLVTAQLTARHVDSFLRLYLDTLRQSLDSNEVDLDPERQLVESVSSSRGTAGQSIFLLSGKGRVIWAEPSEAAAKPVASMVSAVSRQAIAGGADVVSNAYTDDQGKTLVALGVPVKGQGGEAYGALVAVLDLATPMFKGFVEPVSLGQTGFAELVDSQGLVMASSRSSRLFSKSDHTDQFADMIRVGRPSVGTCHSCHESPEGSSQVEPDVLAFAPLSTAPWGIAIWQSEGEVLGPTRDLQRALVLVSAFAILAALGMVGIGSRVVVQPVRDLTAASRRISRGDLESPVDSAGPAEVGELARAFDEMRARLRESLNSLEQTKAELECRVQQRTRELSGLLEVSKVLASSLELRELLSLVARKTPEVLPLADAGFVALYDERSGRLSVRAHWGYHPSIVHFSPLPGEGIAGRVFQNGKPELVSSAEDVRQAISSLDVENRAWLTQARQGHSHSASIVALPLMVQSKATGAMLLEHHRGDREFSPSDLRLAQALADQLAVAVANAMLYQELSEKERLRGELLDKVIGAQEEERRRIARELHDDTCQSLAALSISLEQLSQNLPEPAQAARENLSRLKGQVRDTIQEVRTMALNLRPSLLDDLGLKLAIDWYATEQMGPRGLEVTLDLEGAPEGLSPALETVLFRITQEALNNVIKHSGADCATVRLSSGERQVILEVEDDGLGFEVDRVLGPDRPRNSLGLHGMMERATLSGGKLLISSAPGRGTKVRAELPLEVS